MTALLAFLAVTISNPTLIVLCVAMVSAGVPAAAVIWRSRKSSPDSMAVVLTSSAQYLAEMHARLEALEQRVERLERENRAYYRLHGPLPEGAQDA